ncbi:SprT-like domain-containing protein Spartan [Diplonema papillatum]|nr:SprT-like domain-containing protein Spartan [Diplonema papillatum]
MAGVDLELLDPCPDVHALFVRYNDELFDGKLGSVYVEWSKRMTLCAGTCSYERRGKSCCIRLSGPLLKLRPRSDTINTLLHECIHAYLFVTNNNTDRDDHGPVFCQHMNRINRALNTTITTHHTFHDEVEYYRKHHWECDRCKWLYKAAMNRAPGTFLPWFSEHQKLCGGAFVKIKEPEGYGEKKKKKQPQQQQQQQQQQQPRKRGTGTAEPPVQKGLPDYFKAPAAAAEPYEAIRGAVVGGLDALRRSGRLGNVVFPASRAPAAAGPGSQAAPGSALAHPEPARSRVQPAGVPHSGGTTLARAAAGSHPQGNQTPGAAGLGSLLAPGAGGSPVAQPGPARSRVQPAGAPPHSGGTMLDKAAAGSHPQGNQTPGATGLGSQLAPGAGGSPVAQPGPARSRVQPAGAPPHSGGTMLDKAAAGSHPRGDQIPGATSLGSQLAPGTGGPPVAPARSRVQPAGAPHSGGTMLDKAAAGSHPRGDQTPGGAPLGQQGRGLPNGGVSSPAAGSRSHAAHPPAPLPAAKPASSGSCGGAGGSAAAAGAGRRRGAAAPAARPIQFTPTSRNGAGPAPARGGQKRGSDGTPRRPEPQVSNGVTGLPLGAPVHSELDLFAPAGGQKRQTDETPRRPEPQVRDGVTGLPLGAPAHSELDLSAPARQLRSAVFPREAAAAQIRNPAAGRKRTHAETLPGPSLDDDDSPLFAAEAVAKSRRRIGPASPPLQSSKTTDVDQPVIVID